MHGNLEIKKCLWNVIILCLSLEYIPVAIWLMAEWLELSDRETRIRISSWLIYLQVKVCGTIWEPTIVVLAQSEKSS